MLLAWNKIIPIYRPITTANDSLREYPCLVYSAHSDPALITWQTLEQDPGV